MSSHRLETQVAAPCESPDPVTGTPLSPSGISLTADFRGVRPGLLRDGETLTRMVRQALVEAGCRIVAQSVHAFDGGGAGVTGVFVLAESHAVFHTYPEWGYLGFDLFACGRVSLDGLLARLTFLLGPCRIESHQASRAFRCPEPCSAHPQAPFLPSGSTAEEAAGVWT